MPQMAPMNWLMLMCYFSFILFLFLSFNFYYKIYQINSFSVKKKKNLLVWKW